MSSRTRRSGLSCPCGKITRIERIVDEGGFLKVFRPHLRKPRQTSPKTIGQRREPLWKPLAKLWLTIILLLDPPTSS
jgi:hypothetical protein